MGQKETEEMAKERKSSPLDAVANQVDEPISNVCFSNLMEKSPAMDSQIPFSRLRTGRLSTRLAKAHYPAALWLRCCLLTG